MKIKIVGTIIQAAPPILYDWGIVSKATHTATGDVQEAIEALADDAGAEVFIDSPGGSVTAAVGMAQAIRAGIKRGAIATVRVGAMAGSSAALIAVRATLDGAKLVVGDLSKMLIHKPFVDYVGGGAAALDSVSKVLKGIFSEIMADLKKLGGEAVAKSIAEDCADTEAFATLNASQMRDWFRAEIDEEEDKADEDDEDEKDTAKEDDDDKSKAGEDEDEEEDGKAEEDEDEEEDGKAIFDDGMGGAMARLVAKVAAKINTENADFEKRLSGLQAKKDKEISQLKNAGAELEEQRKLVAKLQKDHTDLSAQLADAQAAAKRAEELRAELVASALTPSDGRSNTIAALVAAGKTPDAWDAAVKEAGGYVQARKKYPGIFEKLMKKGG